MIVISYTIDEDSSGLLGLVCQLPPSTENTPLNIFRPLSLVFPTPASLETVSSCTVDDPSYNIKQSQLVLPLDSRSLSTKVLIILINDSTREIKQYLGKLVLLLELSKMHSKD